MRRISANGLVVIATPSGSARGIDDRDFWVAGKICLVGERQIVPVDRNWCFALGNRARVSYQWQKVTFLGQLAS